MTTQSNACACKTCRGNQCTCGCQNAAPHTMTSCQCGEVCMCGDTCNCEGCQHMNASVPESR